MSTHGPAKVASDPRELTTKSKNKLIYLVLEIINLQITPNTEIDEIIGIISQRGKILFSIALSPTKECHLDFDGHKAVLIFPEET